MKSTLGPHPSHGPYFGEAPSVKGIGTPLSLNRAVGMPFEHKVWSSSQLFHRLSLFKDVANCRDAYVGVQEGELPPLPSSIGGGRGKNCPSY